MGLTGLTVPVTESSPVRQIQRQWAGWMDGESGEPFMMPGGLLDVTGEVTLFYKENSRRKRTIWKGLGFKMSKRKLAKPVLNSQYSDTMFLGSFI